MSARTYPSPGFTVPVGELYPVPVLAVDDANGQRIAIAATGTAEDAAPLPEGCDLVLVTNLGANVIHVRTDGTAASNTSLPILAGDQREVLVTDPARVISILGTAADVVVISPFEVNI